MGKVTLLVLVLSQMLPLVVMHRRSQHFNKAGEMLHPQSAVGLVSSTATRVGCAVKCLANVSCLTFYHNPSDDTCYLASPDQVVVPDTSFPDIPANRFEYFTTWSPWPRTCLEVKTCGNTNVNGEYWIYPSILGEAHIKVYCDAMDTGTPKEYISLQNINFGDQPLECNVNCNGERTIGCVDKYVGHVEYSKIRIDISTMIVERTDRTFASGTGSLKPYGQAGDCYNTIVGTPEPPYACGPKGEFQIDVTGTGLKFNNQSVWTAKGAMAIALVTPSADGKVVHGLCGGYCGDCKVNFIKLDLDPTEDIPESSATAVEC